MIIAMLTVIWIPVITIWEKSSSVWEPSYMWGVPICVAITFIMLLNPHGKDMRFSDGARIKVKGLWLLKLLFYVLAWVPWYLCIVIRFNVHPLHALWAAPVALVVLVLWAMFGGEPDPNGTGKVYSEDYRSVRLYQESDGLNPNALPPVFMNNANKDAIMRMTSQNWHAICLRLDAAGYSYETFFPEADETAEFIRKHKMGFAVFAGVLIMLIVAIVSVQNDKPVKETAAPVCATNYTPAASKTQTNSQSKPAAQTVTNLRKPDLEADTWYVYKALDILKFRNCLIYKATAIENGKIVGKV